MTVCLIKARSEDVVQAVLAATDLDWHVTFGPEADWDDTVWIGYANDIAQAEARAARMTAVPAWAVALLQGGTNA
ncbi:hypothetical protein [Streptomyces albidoflavus]|uniref:hypothetical protein n=1 Tax=Streptomyces albidoflavus TaxID=1886 RepID=UPI0033CCF67F